MTLKTKKIDKIVIGLQQGLENHQGRSSIFMKKLFKRKIDTKRLEPYKQYKNLFEKSFTIKTNSRKVKIILKLQENL